MKNLILIIIVVISHTSCNKKNPENLIILPVENPKIEVNEVEIRSTDEEVIQDMLEVVN